MTFDTSAAAGDGRLDAGYWPGVSLLLIPIFLVVLFGLPFVMALLEPKKMPPTHRAPSRRPTSH